MTDKIFFDITALQYQLKNMTRKVKEFESGKKYLKMRQEFESVFDRQNMTIKKPEKELAAAHAETVTVRKIWSGAMDDMEAECKKEIHSLQREYLRAVKKTTEAERQRDEARTTRPSQTEGKRAGENPAGSQGTCIIHANVWKPQTQ